MHLKLHVPASHLDEIGLILEHLAKHGARWRVYEPWLDQDDPVVAANALICLIHQANYLLDQQIIALEQAFVEGGGYSEALAAARIAERQKKRDQTDRSDQTDPIPTCPQCGRLMTLRTSKLGKNPGSQFWGCTGYPECKGVIPV